MRRREGRTQASAPALPRTPHGATTVPLIHNDRLGRILARIGYLAAWLGISASVLAITGLTALLILRTAR
jgi:hypothetical protein